MANETLKDRLVEELKDLYSAEKQLTKALPKMAKAATEQELKEAIQSHLAETQEHVARLEQAFEILEDSPRGKKCAGMEGLIKEGDEAIKEEEQDLLCDIAMISAAQRVEHYEIAGYRAVIRHTEHLGLDEVRELLEQTLQEEESADEKLGSICEALCSQAVSLAENQAAAGEPKSSRARS